MQEAALIIATLSMGLMAGVFAIYANAIMPGLGRTDDRTFVGAFQSIDTTIINPLFFGTFFGALLFTGITAALHLGKEFRSVLPWIVAALVLYLAVFVITVRVNVPPQRRHQGGWSARWHCRSRPGTRGVRRSKMGPLESHSRTRHDRRIRVSRMGPRAARPRRMTAWTQSGPTVASSLRASHAGRRCLA